MQVKAKAPLPVRGKRMSAAAVQGFLHALEMSYPNARSELSFSDPFTLLVAVVLSAQTTDKAVNEATRDLFAVASTPAAMAKLGAAGIAPYIRRLGLWQAKARNVAALAEHLLERHAGKVPAERAALEALPGVGRKSANVVLNVAFGEAVMPVDTHVFRLANRTGLAPGPTVRAVEEALVARIPTSMLRDAHHWLVLHGRYVCKARRPECWRCAGVRFCTYPAKNMTP